MKIFPAIDLYDGKAVRLYKGDFSQMTVYNENAAQVALQFRSAGAKYMHLVDLEGAKQGSPANADVIKDIRMAFGGFVELGGGIRNMETVEYYLSLGIDRVILGTAAVTDPEFLKAAVKKYPNRIAVGVDLLDGFVAIKGWTEKTQLKAEDFFRSMQQLGIKTIICTDMSRDGAMQGTNRELYKRLSQEFSVNIIASGGVSNMEDITALQEMGLYGAIIGKAYYTGAIDLRKAVEVVR